MKDSVYVPPAPPKVWGLLVLLPGCGGLGNVGILQVRDDLITNRKPLSLFSQGFGNHVLVWPWLLLFPQKTILRCEYKSVWEQCPVFLPLILPYSEWCNGMSCPDFNHVSPLPWDQIDLSQSLNPMTWGDSPGLLWFPWILLSFGPPVFIVHLFVVLSDKQAAPPSATEDPLPQCLRAKHTSWTVALSELHKHPYWSFLFLNTAPS